MASDRPNLRNRLFLWLIVAAAAALALLLFTMRPAMDRQAAHIYSSSVRNLTVTIDERAFHLRDGVAELPGAPGSVTMDTLRLVGEPVSGDLNGDGNADAALLLANDPGGSGTFYYAVVAVNDGGSFHATNSLPLGDRIKPQDVSVRDGAFVYRYLARDPSQSMVVEPRLPETVTVRLDPNSGRIEAVS